jgi:outer membrane protein assembly factor BamE
MNKITIFVASIAVALGLLTLNGCSYFHVYKQDIQQGNLLEADKMAQVKIGMSFGQVTALLGDPVMTQVLSNHRVDYIYWFKSGATGEVKTKRLALTFQNGTLVAVDKKIRAS